MAIGGPSFREIMAKSRSIFQCRQTPLFSDTNRGCGFPLSHPIFAPLPRLANKWAKLSNHYPRLGLGKGYVGMAPDGPRFQEIMAKPWPLSPWPKRPSIRTIIQAKEAIFLTPFPYFFQGG